jgi:lysyl-tRNA synthetase, class I
MSEQENPGHQKSAHSIPSFKPEEHILNSLHWADQTARKIIKLKGEKPLYTCASGITPSGVVHIGNFREIITTELVVRALKDLGKNVRFIYSWDDYDVFRKVPKDMPKQDLLTANLRKPICDVPDVYEVTHSYAAYNQQVMEKSLPPVGIYPEFLYQHKKYRAGEYTNGIKLALQRAHIIRDILNKFRKEARDEKWMPLFVYNPQTNTDDVKDITWDGDDTITFSDAQNNVQSLKISEGKYISLPWRVDWPMRWSVEQVDFEPGGKDHSSPGGSYDTAKEIVKEVYGFEAPLYIMYDFISIKGGKGKMSSSKGGAVILADVLEIYEPQVTRFLFAGTRPDAEFAISFDGDVIKVYEDFDKCERIYYGLEDAKTDKDTIQQKRIYELSVVTKPAPKMCLQPGFRHITTLLQIYQGDIDRVVEWYITHEAVTDADIARIKQRAECAKNWLIKYAPDEFVFKVNSQFDPKCIEPLYIGAFERLRELILEQKTPDEKGTLLWEYCKSANVNIKEFFRLCYQLLISKDKGPKLLQFIHEIGNEDVANRLKVALNQAKMVS